MAAIEPETEHTTASERDALPDEFAAYLPHLQRRWQAQQAAWLRRHEEAWSAARDIADLLHSRFAADQVIAFGSLVHPARFSDRSDVDLAVSGIAAGRFFTAWAAAAFVCPFELDLVDLADCAPALRALIEEEGVRL